MVTSIKTCFSALVYLTALTFLSFTVRGEDHAFELTGLTADNNTPLADVRITVYEESIFMTQYSTSTNGKFSFALEFNKNFKIILEKADYASEVVIVNTSLPQGFPEQRMSHHLSLKMFSLSKETFPFTFEEPVAKIFFNQVIKGFTNEMNYKKTFQTKLEKDPTVHDQLGNSGISEEYKFELSLRRNQPQKKKDTKTVEESTTVNTKPKEYRDLRTKTNKETTENTALNKKTVEENKTAKTQTKPLKEEITAPKKKVESTSVNVVKTAKNEKLMALYEEQKKSTGEREKKEYKNNECETLMESTRVINRVVILKNEKVFEYTEITYKNGGVYYFKNGVSISAEVFKREIKQAK